MKLWVLSGSFTSRIGAGLKQKAEAAPSTQRIKAGQPRGNLLSRFGTISSRGRKDANTVWHHACMDTYRLVVHLISACMRDSMLQQSRRLEPHSDFA